MQVCLTLETLVLVWLIALLNFEVHGLGHERDTPVSICLIIG